MQVMAATSIPVPTNSAALKLWNGHHTPKVAGTGYGTVYRGPIENIYSPAQPYTMAEGVENMHSAGFVAFPGVLKADEVASLRAKMDAMGESDEKYDVKGWCFNKHITTDFTQDANMIEYIDKGGIADVAETVLGGCVAIGGASWITGQGREMGIHVDYLPVPLPEDILRDTRVRVPVFSCTAHYYLNDMTLDLGPTLIIPGSHRAGRPPCDESTWNGHAPRALMAKAGDVVMFRGELWHGAAKNTTTERRYVVQVHYRSMSLFRPYGPSGAESEYSSEVLKIATERQKRLLGIAS